MQQSRDIGAFGPTYEGEKCKQTESLQKQNQQHMEENLHEVQESHEMNDSQNDDQSKKADSMQTEYAESRRLCDEDVTAPSGPRGIF